MHPIEHLRYVARSQGADGAMLVREAATALATLRADPGNLVIACRRIIERHPEAGQLWWMCARLLVADDPSSLAWEIAEQMDDDPTERIAAEAFGDGDRVVTVGFPHVAGAAIVRRGNVEVLAVDAEHEASSFVRILDRCDVSCETVPAEYLAGALRVADVVVVDAVAACPERVLAPVGSHVVAAVAASVGTPVRLVAGLGTRLPSQYVTAIAGHVLGDDGDDGDEEAWDHAVEDLPLNLVSDVVTVEGLSTHLATALRPDCPFAPELLRTSPF